MSERLGNFDPISAGWKSFEFLLFYIATKLLDRLKVKRHHIIGGLAIGSGESGIALSSAILYVWVLYIIAPNLQIVRHSPLLNGLYLLAGLVSGVVVFAVFGLSCVLVTLFGVVTINPTSRKAEYIRRYVFRKRSAVRDRFYHFP